MKGRYRHSILVVVLLLAACGVKREVVSVEQEAAEVQRALIDTGRTEAISLVKSGNFINDGGGIDFPDKSIEQIAGTYTIGERVENFYLKESHFGLLIVISQDGSWQLYDDSITINSGIISRYKRDKCYFVYNYKHQQVLLMDTTSISGHIHKMKFGRFLDTVPEDEIEIYKNEYYGLDSLCMTVYKMIANSPLPLPLNNVLIMDSYHLMFEGRIYGLIKKIEK